MSTLPPKDVPETTGVPYDNGVPEGSVSGVVDTRPVTSPLLGKDRVEQPITPPVPPVSRGRLPVHGGLRPLDAGRRGTSAGGHRLRGNLPASGRHPRSLEEVHTRRPQEQGPRYVLGPPLHRDKGVPDTLWVHFCPSKARHVGPTTMSTPQESRAVPRFSRDLHRQWVVPAPGSPKGSYPDLHLLLFTRCLSLLLIDVDIGPPPPVASARSPGFSVPVFGLATVVYPVEATPGSSNPARWENS